MKAAIASIRKELAGIYPKEETESLIFLIFEKLKGYSRTRFLLAKDELLNMDELLEIAKIVARLKNHEPIQYILGETEFYGLPFYAVPEVLIPRPETEELVQWIILENQFSAPTILDIGTGTGCIAISLQKNIPNSTVLACDVSPVCIKTAQRNAKLNSADVAVIEYDILNNIPEFRFPDLNIIVSNPPYIRETEKTLMQRNVLDFEPELALFVQDERPLIFYERIADFALIHLTKPGRLYFEINEAFGNECFDMLQQKGFADIQLERDINGKDRMIRAALL
ncbi:MAG: protein-(glutamine-N5) methyltransferase, release factor-specific [Bacteroidetes bacterium GWB2_41_8]|nr:MAG: protein-(glutamine-N5) methyltransferase, release factor-specific [Bacteroidetes bacterium GWB2_41_8]